MALILILYVFFFIINIAFISKQLYTIALTSAAGAFFKS